ncbi:hypothetical protein [uncultured Gimesia sp.]|uniref:hypothetical protein n=1 Tax=uncultured Gimesia sp. TaxID=1678688 RepID=UPI0030D9995E|tara:strand:+ start:147463 stop:148287 length:825 start_codon:yes stop_codon:yes gene_type:complete
MKHFWVQQRIPFLAFAVISLMILAGCYLFSITLAKTSFASGTILLLCILFLASYQLRKKINFLPLGSSSAWLRFHIFIGFLSFVVFAIHSKLQIPNGLLEFILFLTYYTVFLSGVVGLFLSRTIPYRLLSRGEEVLFERIPVHRRKIHDRVKVLVFNNTESDQGTALPDFYHKHLQSYFEGPRHQISHILHSERHLHQLKQKISALQPFLNEQEQVTLQQIAEQIQLKDDLDYQYIFQAIIKMWLFVHVPLTYSLIIFAFYHALAACAFASTSG